MAFLKIENIKLKAAAADNSKTIEQSSEYAKRNKSFTLKPSFTGENEYSALQRNHSQTAPTSSSSIHLHDTIPKSCPL